MSYRQPFKGTYPITQRYGEKDTSNFHTGIDYACPVITPILASADGKVMHAGWLNGGWGYCVIIKHDANHSTLYAHLLTPLQVTAGQMVKQGQEIGHSGSTGNSTGPHLHFEARRTWNDYKSHFNPMDLPLMTVDDATQYPQTAGPRALMPAGVYKVICEYAFIRTWPDLRRDRILLFGELVYIFDDVKYSDSGLPYHFIGAGRCIAEYDTDGTQLIERVSQSK